MHGRCNESFFVISFRTESRNIRILLINHIPHLIVTFHPRLLHHVNISLLRNNTKNQFRNIHFTTHRQAPRPHYNTHNQQNLIIPCSGPLAQWRNAIAMYRFDPGRDVVDHHGALIDPPARDSVYAGRKVLQSGGTKILFFFALSYSILFDWR